MNAQSLRPRCLCLFLRSVRCPPAAPLGSSLSLVLVVLVLVHVVGALRAGEDVVTLQDGTVHKGQVVELGGNRIDLLVPGGAKKILRQEIASVRFDESRRQRTVEDSDVVVRKGGHQIRGKVELIHDGKAVRITLPGGSTAEIPRTEVARIIYRGEALTVQSSTYTVELAAEIDRALAVLAPIGPEAPVDPQAPRAADAMTVEGAERFLADCGIFAIEKARKAFEAVDPRSDGGAALARVIDLYGLKEVVSTTIEEQVGDVYKVLGGSELREKCNLLLLVFPRFPEESVPLAVFLASSRVQESTVRAWSIDFLRRMERNRDLLGLWRRSTGRDQLSAAIALARNRILVGVPTLLEAMELDSVEVRALAEKNLRDVTGKDFGFRADGAPQARRDALARWAAWWRENEASCLELAENVLRQTEAETEERRQAVALWREASADLAAQKTDQAEDKLRRALVLDPGFIHATVGLAIVLYGERGKPCDAADLLDDFRSRPAFLSAGKSREWLLLHLGRSARLCGDLERALSAYKACRFMSPESLEATKGLAECAFAYAASGQSLSPQERQVLLDDALAAFDAALEISKTSLERLEVLQPDGIPPGFDLVYDRRQYNRGVVDLRDRLRRERFDIEFRRARTLALKGEELDAIKALRAVANDMAVDSSDEAKRIQASVRAYLGVLYEKMGRPVLALREYRRIVDDIDPEHADAVQGIARLQRKIQTAEKP